MTEHSHDTPSLAVEDGVRLDHVVELLARPQAGDDLLGVLRRAELGSRVFGAVALAKLMHDGMKKSDYLEPLLAHCDVAAWRVAFNDAAWILGMRWNDYGRDVDDGPRGRASRRIPFGQWHADKPPKAAGGRLPGVWLYDDEIALLKAGWSPPAERAERRRNIIAQELDAAYDWLLSKLDGGPVWLVGRGARTMMLLPWVPTSAPPKQRYIATAPFIELGDGTIRLLREALPGEGCRWDELPLERMALDAAGSIAEEPGARWHRRGAIDHYTAKYGERLSPKRRAWPPPSQRRPAPPERDQVYIYDGHRIERERFELAQAWRALGHPVLSLPLDRMYAFTRFTGGTGDEAGNAWAAEALSTWDAQRAESELNGLVVCGGKRIWLGSATRIRGGLSERGVIACVMNSKDWKDGEEHCDRFEKTTLSPPPEVPETVATLLRGGLEPEVAWTDGFLNTFRLVEVSDIPAFLRALDDGLRSDESLRTDLVGRGELILGGNGRVAVFASVWRAFIDGFQGLTVPWPGASWRAGDAVRRAADADSDTMAKA